MNPLFKHRLQSIHVLFALHTRDNTANVGCNNAVLPSECACATNKAALSIVAVCRWSEPNAALIFMFHVELWRSGARKGGAGKPHLSSFFAKMNLT